MTGDAIRGFVLSYLDEIGAAVDETEGVYRVVFPAGRKRRFGGERSFVFDAAKVQPHVELLEPGSPLLKLMMSDAKSWGGLGVCYTPDVPAGTLLYTFQFTTFSSLKKRTHFMAARLAPEAPPMLYHGIPDFMRSPLPNAASSRDVEKAHKGLETVMPVVEQAARHFASEAVKESTDAFRQSLGRVNEYFQGMRQESATDEARIKKRLGEIQSKLYFAEDGLRQLKLERERDRLTQELYQLKQKRTLHEDKLSTDHLEHVERQRRRHEPKLVIRLAAVTLITAEAPDAPRRPPAEELLPESVQEPDSPHAVPPPAA